MTETSYWGNSNLPYESPDMTFVELKTEGFLCSSTLDYDTPGGTLDDYDPSFGVW